MSQNHEAGFEAPDWHEAFPKISEIGLDSVQQARVLEWYATRLWALQEEPDDGDYYGKSYDPLKIELRSDGSGTAHSYALCVEHSGSGRHHEFASLDELEKNLTNPMINSWRVDLTDAHRYRDQREAMKPETATRLEVVE